MRGRRTVEEVGDEGRGEGARRVKDVGRGEEGRVEGDKMGRQDWRGMI